MSETPFQIKPLHLEDEMDAKITILSKKVEIPAYQFVQQCEVRDLRPLMRNKGADPITLPADFYLAMTNAGGKPMEKSKVKLLLPLVFIAGLTIGIVAFGPFLMKVPFAWAITALLTLMIGMIAGWISHINAKERGLAALDLLQEKLNKLYNYWNDQ